MSRYSGFLSPDITPQSSPSKLTKAQKSRQRREPSGVFSLFQPPQVQQFREAFSLIDHDSDGVVSEQDLKHIFTSLGAPPLRPFPSRTGAHSNDAGITPSKATLDDLLADRPGDRRGSTVHSRAASFETPADVSSSDRGITFPMFLTMMGEHLYDFDAEPELLAAFECFDENDSGLVKCDEIRKWLGDVGEKMEPWEVRLVVARSL